MAAVSRAQLKCLVFYKAFPAPVHLKPRYAYTSYKHLLGRDRAPKLFKCFIHSVILNTVPGTKQTFTKSSYSKWTGNPVTGNFFLKVFIIKPGRGTYRKSVT